MGFREDLQSETVASLPIRQAIIAMPYTLVRAAIAMMRNKTIGCTVIVDHSRRPLGIFTDRSVIDVLTKRASLDESPICHFSDPNFVVVRESDPILSVWDAVQSSGARFVCVTDSDNQVIGITGQRGLSEYVSECFARQVTVQRLGCNPWMTEREGA